MPCTGAYPQSRCPIAVLHRERDSGLGTGTWQSPGQTSSVPCAQAPQEVPVPTTTPRRLTPSARPTVGAGPQRPPTVPATVPQRAQELLGRPGLENAFEGFKVGRVVEPIRTETRGGVVEVHAGLIYCNLDPPVRSERSKHPFFGGQRREPPANGAGSLGLTMFVSLRRLRYWPLILQQRNRLRWDRERLTGRRHGG